MTALFAMSLASSGFADTEGEHTVLLTAARDQAALRERLRTELDLGGWLVVEMPPQRAGLPRLPDEVARQVHASVALRLDERGDVELWVVDTASDTTIHHETIPTDPSDGPDIITLRVVEILRARLLKLGVSLPSPPARPPSDEAAVAPPPAAEAPPPPANAAAPEPALPISPPHDVAPRPPPTAETTAHRAVDVVLSPLASFSPGGLGMMPELGLGAKYVLDRTWAFGVSGVVPIGFSSVESAAGSVSVHWGFAGISAERRMTFGPGALVVGVASGVLTQRLSGDANPPYRSATDWVTVFGAFGNLGGRFNLSRTARLCVDGGVGFAAPRPVVVAGDDRLATWGRPLVLLSAGLEWEAWSSSP